VGTREIAASIAGSESAEGRGTEFANRPPQSLRDGRLRDVESIREFVLGDATRDVEIALLVGDGEQFLLFRRQRDDAVVAVVGDAQ